jgi:hypothetical protein
MFGRIGPTSHAATYEGSTLTFVVELSTAPTADVTIGVESSNIEEAVVSAAALTFSSSNWMAGQTVTVTGVDDALDDGSQPYTVSTSLASSQDPTFDGAGPIVRYELLNHDNDGECLICMLCYFLV